MSRMMKTTLFGIALFFLLIVGSFVWFVATWDPAKEQPVVRISPSSADALRGLT